MEIVADSVEVIGTHGTLLVPTSLHARSGEAILVTGNPNSGRTAFALALSGRLRPTRGTVRLDGSSDLAALRRRVAVVDAPAVSEPDGAITVRDAVAEGLSIAGRRSGRRKVRSWLHERELDERANERFERLPPPSRLRLLMDLAVEARGVEALVLDCPDRHGGDPAHWYALARREADRGRAVIVLCSEHSAQKLDIDPVRIGADGTEPDPSTTDQAEGAR
ncbi:hypothetical protein [Parasphingorhabdus pacifica]